MARRRSHLGGSKLVPVDLDDGDDGGNVRQETLVRIIEAAQVLDGDARFTVPISAEGVDAIV